MGTSTVGEQLSSDRTRYATQIKPTGPPGWTFVFNLRTVFQTLYIDFYDGYNFPLHLWHANHDCLTSTTYVLHLTIQLRSLTLFM